jgi:hypothetical protein
VDASVDASLRAPQFAFAGRSQRLFEGGESAGFDRYRAQRGSNRFVGISSHRKGF